MDDKDETYQCSLCQRVFGRKAALKRHVDFDHARRHETDDILNVVDQPEDSDFDESISAPSHLLVSSTEHFLNSRKRERELDPTGGRYFDCPICGKSFKNAKTFNIHRLAHGASDPYTCPDNECGATFKSKALLRSHLESHAAAKLGKQQIASSIELVAISANDEIEQNIDIIGTVNVDDYAASSCEGDIEVGEDQEKIFVKLDDETNLKLVMDSLPLELSTGPELHQNINSVVTKDDLVADDVVNGTEDENSVYSVIDGNSIDDEVQEMSDGHLENGEQSPANIGDEQWVSKSLKQEPGIKRGPGRPRKYPFTFAAAPKLKARSPDDDGSVRKRGRPRRSEDELVLEMLRCKVCQAVFNSDVELCDHLLLHLTNSAYICELCDFVSTLHERFLLHMQLLHKRRLKVVELKNELGEEVGGDDVILEEMEDDGEMPLDEEDRSEDAQAVTESDWTKEQQADAIVAINQLMGVKKRSQAEPSKRGRPKADVAQPCPVCDKVFANSSSLKQHLITHTGTRNYECHVCYRNFLNEEQLTAHLDNHPGVQQFQCNECNRVFKLEYRIREHMRVHTNERPFLCSQCGKAFKSGNTLRIHQLTHTDIMPYECSICQRKFRENGTLTRHFRTHTGEKPFVCRFCGRAFAVQGALARHLKQAKVHCPRAAEADPSFINSMPHFRLMLHNQFQEGSAELLPPDDTASLGVPSETLDSSTAPTYFMVVKEDKDRNDPIQMISTPNSIVGKPVSQSSTAGNAGTVAGAEYVLLSSSGDRLMLLNEQTGEVVEMMQQYSDDTE